MSSTVPQSFSTPLVAVLSTKGEQKENSPLLSVGEGPAVIFLTPLWLRSTEDIADTLKVYFEGGNITCHPPLCTLTAWRSSCDHAAVKCDHPVLQLVPASSGRIC